MRLPGRAQATIEVLDDIVVRHRPAAVALKDWATSHRFAGSRDRAAIGNLVHDILRQRASLAHAAGSDDARALVLAALRDLRGLDVEQIMALGDDRFGPAPLREDERAWLQRQPDDPGDAWIAGNYPRWLEAELTRVFGDEVVAEMTALTSRAPLDIRVNTLKSSPQKVARALARYQPQAGRFTPLALRFSAPGSDARNPNVEAETGHARGHYEVQDEGSQIAAALVDARAHMQVLDVCAGAGGKTLALAAAMENSGQIHAFDSDRHRLRPIHERLRRAGARNVQVIAPDHSARLDDLIGRMDRVLVDAPCSGSGAWRRRPDAKWRLTDKALASRRAQQCALLEQAAAFVKPGGRLVYVTCSLLPCENGDQVAAFLDRHESFALVPFADVWHQVLPGKPPPSADGNGQALLLTPHRHHVDGFFIAVMERRKPA